MNIEYVSPRITRSEWDSGAKSDVDVFEDQLRGWLFEQARAIAPNGHSGPAILALVSPFFEVTACYLKGESSRYHETEFLEHGLQAVFPKIDSVAHREYINEVRNGFAHEAMFRRAALHRADKNFPPFGMVNNFLHLDPWWILDRAEDYFDSYVAKVRNRDMSVYDNFFKFMMIRGAQQSRTRLALPDSRYRSPRQNPSAGDNTKDPAASCQRQVQQTNSPNSCARSSSS